MNEDGENPINVVADYDRKGTVTIIFQIVGATTMTDQLNEGDYIQDFAGPLGTPTNTENLKKVAVVGGGVGCAIAYPVAKKLHLKNCTVHSIIGFRNKELVILEDEFKAVSDRISVMTDDGSYGEKGLVTDALKKLIESGEQYDEVFAIGPLVMMKYVSKLTREYGIKTTVSMNHIMIDGTGMCSGCRLTVGGKQICLVDVHFVLEVDFDEAIERSTMYREFEQQAREDHCRLFNGGAEIRWQTCL